MVIILKQKEEEPVVGLLRSFARSHRIPVDETRMVEAAALTW